MLENEPLSRCELICINKLGTWTWPTANETDRKSRRNYDHGGEDCNTGGVGDGGGDGGNGGDGGDGGGDGGGGGDDGGGDGGAL